MSRTPRSGYTVTGPGLDKNYPDPGPALSRALTAASATEADATYYVRAIDGTPIGYAERDGKTVQCVRH